MTKAFDFTTLRKILVTSTNSRGRKISLTGIFHYASVQCYFLMFGAAIITPYNFDTTRFSLAALMHETTIISTYNPQR